MAQLVEHDLAKVGAAGSSPVSRLKRETIQQYGFFSLCELYIELKKTV